LKWEQHHIDRLIELWKLGWGQTPISRQLSKEWGVEVTRNMIIGKSRDLSLHYGGGNPMELAKGHPAVVKGRSLFPSKVLDPDEYGVLKAGQGNRKLGAGIEKGRWKGMPIYALSLEERATCPRTCLRFRDCYGNHMHNAKRYRHGPRLIKALDRELAVLQQKHPGGFVVRLHVLGDFYSPEYVAEWFGWLQKYPALNIFGYTAWQKGTPVGEAIELVRTWNWDRFSVRTSGADDGPRTITIPKQVREQGRLALKNDGEVIICPVQTGQTASCSTCGVCWGARDKAVAFIRH
jgi:hypothetical protein